MINHGNPYDPRRAVPSSRADARIGIRNFVVRAVWFSPLIIVGLAELALFGVAQLQRGPSGKHGSLLSNRELLFVWTTMTILGILCFTYYTCRIRSMAKSPPSAQQSTQVQQIGTDANKGMDAKGSISHFDLR